jgi:hypothetical protein
VSQGESQVLAHQARIGRRYRITDQETADPREIIVGEEMGGFAGEEPRGDEDIEALATGELQGVAEPLEGLAADAAFARLEPAERAVVDAGHLRGLLLRQAAFGAEAHEHLPELLGPAGRWLIDSV